MAFEPNYRITAEAAKALMAIEASRVTVDRLPIHRVIAGVGSLALDALFNPN